MTSAIGLDIGSSSVRVVQITTRRGGAPTLDRVGSEPLPAGAVADGEVADPASVTEALRTLWSRHGLRGRRVALGVSNQHVVVRQVDLPYLPEKELRQSLPFQVDEAIPIPVDQAILDYHPLEELEDAGGARISRILLVAAERGMVGALVGAVEKAKLQPVLLDLDAFALLRSLAPDAEERAGLLDEPAGELLVDVGSVVTNLIVHERGVPRFVRILLMGGDAIVGAVAAELGGSREEAAARIAELGILPADELDAAGPEGRIVAERAGRIIEEIRGSLDYYAAQVDAIPVTRAILAGGASRLRNLDARLAEVLDIPVERGHPLQSLRIGKTGIPRDELVALQPELAVAVGLALGAAER